MITLYHHGSSVCAAKVRLVLAEKQVPWEGRYVDILAGDQFTPEFKALNPKTVVPVLVDDGKVVTESTIIAEYLEDRFPEPSVFPDDPFERAGARLWARAVDDHLHAACAAVSFIASHRFTVLKMGAEKVAEFIENTPAENNLMPDWHERKKQFIQHGLEAPGAKDVILTYDRYMRKMNDVLASQPWLCGNDYTIADISLTPYVNRLAMLGLEGFWSGGRLAHLERWFDRVRERPTFQSEIIKWIPQSLIDDMADNGPKSWPEIRLIIGA